MNTAGIALTWLFGCVGLVLGGLVSWVLCTRRAARRELWLAQTAREQISQSTQGLRQANTKLMTDLDKLRAMASQGQSAALAEQRALVLHLQSQLRAAHMEMDSLQQRASPVVASTSVPESAEPESAEPDGFALTRPFER